MNSTKYIRLQKIIQFHGITRKDMDEWMEYEFFEIHRESDDEWIHEDELDQVEQVIRLYRDLGVNNAGIDIILRLTNKLRELQR